MATNTDYRVVISYDTNAFLGTLWIDPVSTSDANVQTIDTVTGATIGFFSFRQSSANGQAGQLVVDDLYVGNSFDDVNVGAVKPATVYYQPIAAALAFENASTNLYCVSGGAGTVSFQWTHAGTNLVDDANYVGSTSNVLSLVSAITNQSGEYRCIVTSTTNAIFASSVTSAVSQVTITNAPIPPTISGITGNTNVSSHTTATVTVLASGPPTLSYQWYYYPSFVPPDAANFSGQNATTLTITDALPNNDTASNYVCVVSNPYGSKTSAVATVTVTPPPAVSIAFLRTLVDPTTYLATNSTLRWQATGSVTTFTNLTTGNTASYYLQDSTAGLNIFLTGTSTFRPAQGDVVTFVGFLSSFNSTLELEADTTDLSTSYTILSNNIALLPAPRPIPFSITNNLSLVETNVEGSIVMLTNVYFGTNAGVVLSTAANATIIVTNTAGETFNLFFAFLDQDTAGQTLPAFANTVVGPLTQNLNNSTTPRNQGYSVTVTRFSDIVTNPITVSASHAGNSTTLTWGAAPVSYTYGVQASTDVLGPYASLTNKVHFTDSSGTFTDTSASGSQKFYRVTTP
ncbi:MAG: hypothetical protein EPO07_05895 [Verrucomicrobia bacterium]|nr:MAG: hypothetical protein EPO07_05895 [Verrucomicrobiota bacterium]